MGYQKEGWWWEEPERLMRSVNILVRASGTRNGHEKFLGDNFDGNGEILDVDGRGESMKTSLKTARAALR